MSSIQVHRSYWWLTILLMCAGIIIGAATVNKQQPTEPMNLLLVQASHLDIPHLVEHLTTIDNLQTVGHVIALLECYYPTHITDVSFRDDDIIFSINGTDIWYAQGKLLSGDSLHDSDRYRRILYPYRIEPLVEVIKHQSLPRRNFSGVYLRSSDFQATLLGASPSNIEHKIKNFRVLDFTVRLHPIAGQKAVQASQEILMLARTDPSVAEFIKTIKTITGFTNRTVKNSANISMHAFGIAFDIIPYSYGGKMAYWIWAMEQDPDNWLSKANDIHERWTIPQKIVEIFESYGFIWGGKWRQFDMIHFEYKPELIAYAKLRKLADIPSVVPQ